MPPTLRAIGASDMKGKYVSVFYSLPAYDNTRGDL